VTVIDTAILLNSSSGVSDAEGSRHTSVVALARQIVVFSVTVIDTA
jgi:hypothetical protein